MHQCYNKGCGKEFDPAENSECEFYRVRIHTFIQGSCLYHPGDPVFHDAKKKWSCCGKYSTDFTEFLSIKGCVSGKHNDVKPVQPPKDVESVDDTKKVVNTEEELLPSRPKPVYERPNNPGTFCSLKCSVMPSLLESLKSLKFEEIGENRTQETTVTEKGPKCFNGGCEVIYQGPETNSQLCIYHPGTPIFHEGAKFWTCCNRKTTDFEAFRQQEGCTTGVHHWTEAAALSSNLSLRLASSNNTCRFDWFQLPNCVTLNIYAKDVIPDSVDIKANEIDLVVYFEYGPSRTIFSKSFTLYGVIDPQESSVNILPKKVEITMKKAHPMSWSKLEFEPVVTE
ncbi:Integrin beta-1-binding protein 2 [Cichlidogyrus casuarinus]|uniref:Integrin beta-1-binding protein 2 n=1 Tax=Cichlidogyrus casuarinus TaxID=1844966 RepID=A0ABD2QJP8_9PLAT